MPEQKMPYGTWPSPITAGQVASNSIRYSGLCVDGDDIYWLEGRPCEKGRSVLVRYRDGQQRDILPVTYSVRSCVHEYGGGAFTVWNGEVWFVNHGDQQVYRCRDDGVVQVTRQTGCRYANLVIDVLHECIYAVQEDHRGPLASEPVNALVCIAMSNGGVTVIASGDDFYATPVLSPDKRQLAWISWRHPHMPWDETVLWLADIGEQGALHNIRIIVSNRNQAIFQPGWSPDGQLYFVNDPDGWWRIYRMDPRTKDMQIRQVTDYQAEAGLPLWQLDMKTYAFQSPHRIIATVCEAGLWRLIKICTDTGKVEPISTPYSSFSAIDVAGEYVAIIASGVSRGNEVVSVNIETGESKLCSKAADTVIDESWISVAQPVSFPTSNGDTAHGFYYAPANPDCVSDGLPPLLVMTHGGPTGSTSVSLDLRNQYWTSRGFAILDVNYRGSTGYGRAYRDSLKGQWGVYDVDDVVAGAEYLVGQGLVDPRHLSIRGNSAGGFTTLAALTFKDTFQAGCSYYGIGDLEALVRDTHKFEAHYLDTLVGRYPQDREVYIKRSPLHNVTRLSCPVIFMQGMKDSVVPPEQAEKMASALQAGGVDVELLMFEDEQHGFRQAGTMIRALQAELAFYGRVYGFRKQ